MGRIEAANGLAHEARRIDNIGRGGVPIPEHTTPENRCRARSGRERGELIRTRAPLGPRAAREAQPHRAVAQPVGRQALGALTDGARASRARPQRDKERE